jgi:hypothetical protein
MKYVLHYKPAQGLSHEDAIAAAERGLELFQKWEQPAGINILQFVTSYDVTSGGWIIFEADDLSSLLEDASVFGMFNEQRLIPVIDIMDALPYEQRALGRLRS